MRTRPATPPGAGRGSVGRRRRAGGPAWPVVGAVAVGGAVGALARYAVSEAWHPAPGAVPWSTFAVNVVGCFAIGLVLVAVTEGTGPPHPLARPFLGTGVVGGFTTFSTYVMEAEDLVAVGAPALAFAYLLGTLAAALVAVQVGVSTARAVRRARAGPGDGRTA